MAWLALAGLVGCSGPALAHGSQGAIILLLPTGYYLVGGAVAVAASFLLLAVVPAARLERVAGQEVRLASLRRVAPTVPSLLSFLLLLVLLYAGVYGSRDPLSNPLPLFIWTIWWVGFTLLQAVTGELWTLFNPWSGPLALLRLATRSEVGRRPLLPLPQKLGYLPAILLFFGFAWFELVDVAPSDPFRLAVAVGAYWLAAFAGMIVFGEAAWTARAEPFGIFFRLVGGMAPLVRRSDGDRVQFILTWPGRGLMERPALPPSGVLFVLLTLASVSFDGFSRTFAWLGFLGVNPLEFPGRSAVQLENTLGLLAAFVLLASAFLLALAAGRPWFGADRRLWPAAGRLVHSILPISIAFHAAHYLTNLLVDGQYAYAAASDPFGLRWDLLGIGHFHVTTSFLNTFEDVTLIWNTQTAIICLGHIVGIVMAHLMAQRLFPAARSAAASQLGLAALMVGYTVFGLWLLSTPVAG
ncbi:MAG: hypothetical protein ACFCVH_09110 [Alphaproteobacteria bacterium]